MQPDLTAAGIIQQGPADIHTIQQYNPWVLKNAGALLARLWQITGDVRLDNAAWALLHEELPGILDFPYSCYRDAGHAQCAHDEHCWGLALDPQINPHLAPLRPDQFSDNLDLQITTAREGLRAGLFTRFGFYPTQNTMHWGGWDFETMTACGGTPFWVHWPGAAKTYVGFSSIGEAEDYARRLIGGDHA